MTIDVLHLFQLTRSSISKPPLRASHFAKSGPEADLFHSNSPTDLQSVNPLWPPSINRTRRRDSLLLSSFSLLLLTRTRPRVPRPLSRYSTRLSLEVYLLRHSTQLPLLQCLPINQLVVTLHLFCPSISMIHHCSSLFVNPSLAT